MIQIVSRYIPFKGFTALTMFPFLFIRKDRLPYFNRIVLRHEETHCMQQIEVLAFALFVIVTMVGLKMAPWYVIFILPFCYYILYGLEFLVKLPFCKFDRNKAYRSISMEQEAFGHELDCEYNGRRKPFAWIVFIFKIVKI